MEKEGESESILSSAEKVKEVTSALLSSSETATVGQEVPIATTTTMSSTSEILPSSSTSRSVIVPSSSVSAGISQPAIIQHTSLPKPPPLIATSSLTSGNTPKAYSMSKLHETSVPSLSSIVKDPVEPNVTPSLSLVDEASNSPVTESRNESTTKVMNTAVFKDPNKSDILQKISPGGPSANIANIGGLGAGKPKSFMSMMEGTSTPKKQSKKAVGGGGSGGRGQGSRNKPSPLSSGVTSKKAGGEHAPSRTSNRNIKRPRTYDEEMDELKSVKASSSSKKAKATSKVSGGVGTVGVVCLEGSGHL